MSDDTPPDPNLMRAFETALHIEDRRRAWAALDPAGRARKWLTEIDVAIPSIQLQAFFEEPDYAVKIHAEWRWDATLRQRGDHVRRYDAECYVVSVAIPIDIFDDQDRYFWMFERKVRQLIRKLLINAVNAKITVDHETLDKYIERNARRAPAP